MDAGTGSQAAGSLNPPVWRGSSTLQITRCLRCLVMLDEPWLMTALACALAGLAALGGRLALRSWSLRQLKTLAEESLAIRRCWSLLDQLPAEVLTQPLRMTFGKIMYVRLKRARRIRPEHPFLRDQQLQIAQLIGTTRGGRTRPLGDKDREEAMAALEGLRTVLSQSAVEGIINDLERQRCAERLDEALTSLRLIHYRQAALEAEHLQRIPQAIDYLRSALRSAEQLPAGDAERREITRQLQALESAAGF